MHAWLHSAAQKVDGAPIGKVECGAIKPCKDLPVSQSQAKWVSRGGNRGFMEIKDQGFVGVNIKDSCISRSKIKGSWRSISRIKDQRFMEVKAMSICSP